MLADRFADVFRDEHRQVRDTLFDLIEAFQNHDRSRIQSLISQTACYTGPHFRYEEEALYPELADIFGKSYIEKLLGDHDQAISTAGKLVELASQESLTDADVSEAVKLIRSILPHVSDCEGLSIMVERLPEEKVQSVLNIRKRSRQAGLDLLQWANTVRRRPVSSPS